MSLGDLDEDARRRLRRERVGFVFQSFNLVPSLIAADNIALPLRLAGRSPDRAWQADVVARVGLGEVRIPAPPDTGSPHWPDPRRPAGWSGSTSRDVQEDA